MATPSDNNITRRRGRPRTGSALSDAERARRYRERKKLRVVTEATSSQKTEPDTVAQLQSQLAAAQDEIRELKKVLALYVTENDESGKTWALQDRKGNARWHTFKSGLSRSEANKQLDKLAASSSTGRYSYRMIEE